MLGLMSLSALDSFRELWQDVGLLASFANRLGKMVALDPVDEFWSR